jgi:hypothetical protein
LFPLSGCFDGLLRTQHYFYYSEIRGKVGHKSIVIPVAAGRNKLQSSQIRYGFLILEETKLTPFQIKYMEWGFIKLNPGKIAGRRRSLI